MYFYRAMVLIGCVATVYALLSAHGVHEGRLLRAWGYIAFISSLVFLFGLAKLLDHSRLISGQDDSFLDVSNEDLRAHCEDLADEELQDIIDDVSYSNRARQIAIAVLLQRAQAQRQRSADSRDPPPFHRN